MDVQDRSHRLDVLTITAPAAPAPAAPTPASSPDFAQSLQRGSLNGPPASSDSATKPKPNGPAGNGLAKNAGPAPSPSAPQADPGGGKTLKSAGPVATPRPAVSQALATPDDGTGLDGNDDESLDRLIADLVAAIAASAPPTTAPAAKSTPENSPPASLVKALNLAVEPAAPPNSGKIADESEESLPAIPAGLQAALADAAVATPSAAANNAATGPLRDEPVESSHLQATPVPVESSQSEPLESHLTTTGNRQALAESPDVPPPQRLSTVATDETELAGAIEGEDPATTSDRKDSANDSAASGSDHPAADAIVAASNQWTDAERRAAPPSTPSHGKTAGGTAAARDVGSDSFDGEDAGASALAAESAGPLGTTFRRFDGPRPANSGADRSGSEAGQALANGGGSQPQTAAIGTGIPSAAIGAGPLESPGAGAPPLMDQLHPVLRQAVALDREMTMTLRPPELGTVRIEVARHEGQVTARLHAETATAHQLLTDQLPQLREALTQLGVAGDQVQILRTDSSQTTGLESRMDGQSDAWQSDGRHDSPQQRPPEPTPADEPERTEPLVAGWQTRTALNLRI